MTYPNIAGAATVLVGWLVFLGWILDVEVLKSVLPGLVSMKPNAALAFIASGLSWWLLSAKGELKPVRRISQAAAAIAALIGTLTLCEYIFGVSLGIDQLLFEEPAGAVGTYFPGRMAPMTALNFILLGAALFLSGQKERGARLVDPLAMTALLVALLAAIGYLYGVRGFYSPLARVTAMAVHTAITFVVLALGILLRRQDGQSARLLHDPGPAGVTVRRLLPGVFLLPIALGWLSLAGQRTGFYSTAFATAMLVVIMISVLSALVMLTASQLREADARRQRAEAEVERYARFYSLSLDMFCISGYDGYFKDLNPTWEKALSYTREELLARPYLDFIHPDDREATSSAAKRQIEQGAELLGFENRYRAKDGAYRWFLWNSMPLPDGKLIYAVARDITERKRREEELRGLNKELETFSYSVSHDLRSPLRAIHGFSQVLLDECAGRLDAEGQRLLGIICLNTRKMGSLIDDLLSFSRVGRQEFTNSEIDMTRLARSVFDEITHGARGRGARLIVHELPRVQGDPAMIRQVLLNLLSNALKYTRKTRDPLIEVGGTAGAEEIAYSVRDNGTGFDMKYSGKLFGVFQRLHSEFEFEGTGVGLAIVQRIIHRHGGRVWAEGKPNQGATFYFTLPLQGDPHDGAQRRRGVTASREQS